MQRGGKARRGEEEMGRDTLNVCPTAGVDLQKKTRGRLAGSGFYLSTGGLVRRELHSSPMGYIIQRRLRKTDDKRARIDHCSELFSSRYPLKPPKLPGIRRYKVSER